MSLNAIRGNKFLAKIFEITVYLILLKTVGLISRLENGTINMSFNMILASKNFILT